jgi:hypothetical protein
MTFQSLGLSQPVLQALALKNYDTPTPIQTQAIPTLLQGRDLLGIAQTGTGKTAAFMLPSIDRLIASNKRPQPRGCRMLVLAPTRELASQIATSARAYAKFSQLSVATVFGGTSVYKNKQDLARGVDVLVATFRFRCLPYSRKLSAIWVASSRVGASTTTRAPPRGAGFGSFSRRCRIGRAKAAVLPVPVWAMPSRSRPSSTVGMAWAWMGVGVW